MAASLPPSTSSTPTPSGGSKLESQTKSTMTPSPASVPHSQAKSEPPAASKAISAPNLGEEKTTETPVEAKKSATSARRSRNAKPKKKKVKETAQCVGYFVDALDRKMLWGEARIIQCNLSTQKIKVHFMGWSKTYDLWTDPMSITAHGRYAPITMKGPEEKSWDGNMHLFEDMLGTIEEPNFTLIPTPAEPKSKVKLAPAPVNKNRSDKKKASIEKTKTAGPSERTAPKREAADVDVVKKAGSKRSVALAVKMKETNGQKIEQPRDRKRQKQVAAQQTSAAKPTASTTRASKKKVALPPDELPQFRELELDDGTVLDFSKQREKSRMERESMKSFLDKCAQIWKEQLGAVSVQKAGKGTADILDWSRTTVR